MTVLKLAARWYKLANGLFSKHLLTHILSMKCQAQGRRQSQKWRNKKMPESPRDTRSPRMAQIHFPIDCYLVSDFVWTVARKQEREKVRASEGGKESGKM